MFVVDNIETISTCGSLVESVRFDSACDADNLGCILLKGRKNSVQKSGCDNTPF